MNEETGKGMEKRMDKNRTTDQSQVFPPPYPAPATGEHRKLPKSDAGTGEEAESLTATYWG